MTINKSIEILKKIYSEEESPNKEAIMLAIDSLKIIADIEKIYDHFLFSYPRDMDKDFYDICDRMRSWKDLKEQYKETDVLTLNEAIAHLEESLSDKSKEWCEECKNEHEQLAEWLKELCEIRLQKEYWM